MDFVFELIVDLIIEGSIEASKSKKIPSPIRYFLILIFITFFTLTISLIIWLGIDTIKNNLIGGIIVILFGILLAILTIKRFIKEYLNKKK